MNAPFELHVALRYLLAKRKQAFISIISLVSTLGVVVGVMALVIALALMTGLQRELRDRLLGSTAHVFVWKVGGIQDYRAEAEKLLRQPHVVGAAPAILGKALVTTDRDQGFIQLKGIDPALESRVTDLARSMRAGSLAALDPSGDDDLPGILIGQDLAARLGARPGDPVTIFTANVIIGPGGAMPRARRLRVAGIFSLGLYEFDSAYGFVTLPVARRLVGESEVTLIELRVDDIYRAEQVAEAIAGWQDGTYLTEHWASMNKSLFSALWLEKMAISITIGLIVMVAALNIVASLILLVMEKHRDIAILKTMGASKRHITTIFMLQGVVIGLVGTAIGAAAGVAVSFVFDRYRLLSVPTDVYQISHVPFVVLWTDFAVVVVAAVVVCFLATIYPSRQAARLDPAEALRYG